MGDKEKGQETPKGFRETRRVRLPNGEILQVFKPLEPVIDLQQERINRRAKNDHLKGI